MFLELFMDGNRVNREEEWHNKNFGGDARAKVRKYRSVLIPIDRLWIETVLNNVNKSTVLLDYGCGTGSHLINFADEIKNGVGIDISEARLEKAKTTAEERKLNNVEFLHMDAMNTTFEAEFFDVINGGGILHHLDLKKSLVEIKRILKTSGVAIFYEPLGTNKIINMYRKRTPEARTIDEQPLRIKDIKLIKSMFSEVKIKYCCFLPLLAVPFRKYRIFNIILPVLYFMDKLLLNKNSPFKWLAWQCIIVIKK